MLSISYQQYSVKQVRDLRGGEWMDKLEIYVREYM